MRKGDHLHLLEMHGYVQHLAEAASHSRSISKFYSCVITLEPLKWATPPLWLKPDCTAPETPPPCRA